MPIFYTSVPRLMDSLDTNPERKDARDEKSYLLIPDDLLYEDSDYEDMFDFFDSEEIEIDRLEYRVQRFLLYGENFYGDILIFINTLINRKIKIKNFKVKFEKILNFTNQVEYIVNHFPSDIELEIEGYYPFDIDWKKYKEDKLAEHRKWSKERMKEMEQRDNEENGAKKE